MADRDPVNFPPDGDSREDLNHTIPEQNPVSPSSETSTIPFTPSRYYDYELPDTESPGSVKGDETASQLRIIDNDDAAFVPGGHSKCSEPADDVSPTPRDAAANTTKSGNYACITQLPGGGVDGDVNLPAPTKKRKTSTVSTISYADARFVPHDTALPRMDNDAGTYHAPAPSATGKRKREVLIEEEEEEE